MTKQSNVQKPEDIKRLIKNFNLLRIVEKIDSRRTIMSNTSFSNTEIEELPKKYSVKEEIVKEDDERLSGEVKCKKHSLPVHSYAIGTNLLFCDKCERETSLKTYPLPNVVRDLKRKADSCQVKICLLKNEVDRLRDFFDSYQEEFERSNKSKIEDLFNFLYKIISYNYNTAIHILKQCKAEQKSQIDLKLKELDGLEIELNKMESEMVNLNKLEDREYLQSREKINKMQHKMDNFINYNLELNLLTMKMGIKNEITDKLFNTIQDSYFIDVEFMEIDNEPPSIKHILQKEKYWSCVCGEMNNPLNEIKCITCLNFRRFETVENIFNKTQNISKDNLNLISMRRKCESHEFQENLKVNAKMHNFYAIDLDWFLQWKSFVLNDLEEKILPNNKKKISPNKHIGVLPPGQITNFYLFEKNAKEFTKNNLKKGLKKNEDYVIINEKIWKMFYHNYNGGPEVSLTKNEDIYTYVSSVSEKDYVPYSSIKEDLTCISANQTLKFLDNEEENKIEINGVKTQIQIQDFNLI